MARGEGARARAESPAGSRSRREKPPRSREHKVVVVEPLIGLGRLPSRLRLGSGLDPKRASGGVSSCLSVRPSPSLPPLHHGVEVLGNVSVL